MIELKGKPIKEEIIADIAKRKLAGEDMHAYIICNTASFEAASYMRLVSKLIASLGFEQHLEEVKTLEEAKTAVMKANKDPLGSVFLCRPLVFPGEGEAVEMVDPSKDADMLTSANIGRLTKGNLDYLSGTSSSVRRIIDFYKIPVQGKKALIVGRSISVGLPIALMLMKYNALISVVHSKIDPKIISSYAQNSDIIVLASGKRGLVKEEDIRPNQIVIDCGYLEDGKGDLGFTPDCKMFTPVPGGVGPVTIACLVSNALFLHRQSAKN